MARRTIADEIREEGAIDARQKMLLMGLRIRFGAVPADVEKTIRMTRNSGRLEEWMRHFATAFSLADVHIIEPQ
jgi:hypothetical protein